MHWNLLQLKGLLSILYFDSWTSTLRIPFWEATLRFCLPSSSRMRFHPLALLECSRFWWASLS